MTSRPGRDEGAHGHKLAFEEHASVLATWWSLGKRALVYAA